ncbi:MAG: LysR substrate-binding domain-containing protein [Spirosomataceae bacterium]
MNIQQLEYILAVDKYRHFAKAAEACHVTQPTLSMMIQKLEEAYQLKIFDRSRHPVVPTEVGEKLLAQARIILNEVERFSEIVDRTKNEMEGELKVGILPTIAPYLLPLFLMNFQKKFPAIKLKLAEYVTSTMIEKLQRGELDAGIMILPEQHQSLFEVPLYNEPFVIYTPKKYDKQYLLAKDIDPNELLLLEEGHCFRTQIIQFCELRRAQENAIEYTSGSLETLRHLADRHLGITILPALATWTLSASQQENIKRFAAPQPVRKVSIVTHRDFVKKRFITLLQQEIQDNLPKDFIDAEGITIPLR